MGRGGFLPIMSLTLFGGDSTGWEALASCASLPRELITARKGSKDILFDAYESSPKDAMATDDMCLGCPVIRQCLQTGEENKEWGVRGGVYLENGKINKARNAHKTPEVWAQLSEIHGRQFRG